MEASAVFQSSTHLEAERAKSFGEFHAELGVFAEMHVGVRAIFPIAAAGRIIRAKWHLFGVCAVRVRTFVHFAGASQKSLLFNVFFFVSKQKSLELFVFDVGGQF